MPRPVRKTIASPRSLLVGAPLCAVLTATWVAASGCNVLFGQTDLEVQDPGAGASGAGGNGAGGPGGAGGDCPENEQDNDGDGACAPACSSDTCSSHGTCDDSSGAAACTCDPRFGGEDCASCATGYAGAECIACEAGYQDKDDDGTCELECAASTCSGHGDCDDSSGAATCRCRPDFGGDDCATACAAGTAGAGCAYRIIFGLDIPAAVANWDAVGDVPYDIDDAATVVTFDRVAYRLILDEEEVWVEMDAFTADATELGVPTEALHDVPITNATVVSFSANQASVSAPTDGNVEMWGHCYSAGPNGVYDYDDNITIAQPDCYGCLQVHVAMQPVLSFNRWSSGGGSHDLGIGSSPTGNPDYTFEENAGDYTSRRLEVYVREP